MGMGTSYEQIIQNVFLCQGDQDWFFNRKKCFQHIIYVLIWGLIDLDIAITSTYNHTLRKALQKCRYKRILCSWHYSLCYSPYTHTWIVLKASDIPFFTNLYFVYFILLKNNITIPGHLTNVNLLHLSSIFQIFSWSNCFIVPIDSAFYNFGHSITFVWN